MRILVTGVSGYIGGNIAAYLKMTGEYVIGTCYNRKPKVEIDDYVQCDLSEMESALSQKEFDVVIHVAGNHKFTYIKDLVKSNIRSTQNIISLAEEKHVRQFIFISSISTYGWSPKTINENSDRINLSRYGISKYVCEKLVEESNIPSRIILQLPGVVGGNWCDLSRPWLPMVVGKMLNDVTVRYYNPYLKYNAIVYIDDIAHFIGQIIRTMGGISEVFLLAAQEPLEIIGILKLLKSNLQSQSLLIEEKKCATNNSFSVDSRKAFSAGFRKRSTEEIIKLFTMDIKKEVLSKKDGNS